MYKRTAMILEGLLGSLHEMMSNYNETHPEKHTYLSGYITDVEYAKTIMDALRGEGDAVGEIKLMSYGQAGVRIRVEMQSMMKAHKSGKWQFTPKGTDFMVRPAGKKPGFGNWSLDSYITFYYFGDM